MREAADAAAPVGRRQARSIAATAVDAYMDALPGLCPQCPPGAKKKFWCNGSDCDQCREWYRLFSKVPVRTGSEPPPPWSEWAAGARSVKMLERFHSFKAKAARRAETKGRKAVAEATERRP